MEIRKIDGKFAILFNETPNFVYVAEDIKTENILINGEKFQGWRAMEIKTDIDEPPIINIEFFPMNEDKK